MLPMPAIRFLEIDVHGTPRDEEPERRVLLSG
jgi:hypothetical protein